MNTTYFLNLVAGNVFGTKTTPAIPTTYYIGLSSTAPAIDGTNVTEPSGGGYARVAFNSAMSEPTAGVITNESTVTFAKSTADWGVMTHFVVYDAATGGNLLLYNAMSKPRTVESDNIMVAEPGAITLSVVNITA